MGIKGKAALFLIVIVAVAGTIILVKGGGSKADNSASASDIAISSAEGIPSTSQMESSIQKPAENSSPTAGSIADSAASTTPNSTAQKWMQLDRLHYTEGIVQSFQKNADGTGTLSLQVTKNFHSDADPIDDPDAPFSVGTTQSFTLQMYSTEALQKEADIVIYDCDVSPESDQNTQFIGAVVLFYERDGKYVDGNEKEFSMPPTDYPAFNDVFQ